MPVPGVGRKPLGERPRLAQPGRLEVASVAEILVALSIRDLTPRDLHWCSWSGDALHEEQLATQVERARPGGIDYLAVCPPSDIPIGLGGVDYQLQPGTGTLWQLAVHPALQPCGIGTALIRAAEQRILARGLRRAELAVEDGNPRARALYERFGYIPDGQRQEAWDIAGPDGTTVRYQTTCTVLSKQLG
jgi:ribosomal protein S18 acetylase RimI-like enzyme